MRFLVPFDCPSCGEQLEADVVIDTPTCDEPGTPEDDVHEDALWHAVAAVTCPCGRGFDVTELREMDDLHAAVLGAEHNERLEETNR